MPSQISIVVSLASGAVQTGLTKIRAQFAGLRSDLSHSLGSFLAIGAIEQGLHRLIERGTELSNISRRFGAPAAELQRVANAGRENGAQIEDVARSWNKLTVNQQKAIHGNEEMRKAFESLGVPMKDVAGMTVDQLFYRVADATASAEDRGAAYASVVKLMGRNAGLLYSTLEKGSGQIKAQGDEIGIMSDKTIEKLHAMHIAIERLKQTLFIYGGGIITFFSSVVESIGAMVGHAVNIMGILVDGVTNSAKALKSLASGNFTGWLSEYKDAVSGMGDALQRELGGANQQLKLIWNHPEEHHDDHKKPVDAEIDPTSGEVSKAEKLVTLREQLAELQRKTANDELDSAEKINALIGQRKALIKEAAKEKDEEKKLQLQVDAARVQQEIINAQQAAAKEIQSAQDKLDKATSDTAFASLKTDDERKAFILAEIAKLEKLIAAETDAAEKLRLKTEVQDEKKKLLDLNKTPDVPKIAANSLRRIGGQESGGFAAGLDDKLLREQKEQTKVLKEIATNTKTSNNVPVMP